MELGMIGLGRMGPNTVQRRMRAGHRCVVCGLRSETGAALAKEGAMAATSPEHLVRVVAVFAEGLNILRHANAGMEPGVDDAETIPLRHAEYSQLDLETPYARLLSGAMAGDGALLAREDAIETAWVVVDPVLKRHPRVHPDRRGSWGPEQADVLIGGDRFWPNPDPTGVSG